jgi:CRP/FNR family cyclic AMP-dependent transcriptional regulator
VTVSADSEILDYVVSEESFPDKAYVFKEGGSGDWIYVILEGRVKLKKQTSKGMLTIDTLGEGDIVGEIALFQEGTAKRSSSAIADGPVLVGTLDTDQLIRDWEKQSPRIKKLISSLILNIEDSIQKVVSVVESS